MTWAAPWLAYLPRAFARGRDYHVETGGAQLSAPFIDAFMVEAEGMLRATPHGQVLWRYGALGADPFMALSRCAPARQGEAQAPVVWALLLPHAYVRSSRCALAALPARFPDAALLTVPPPLDLTLVGAPAPPDPALAALISRYLESGAVQVHLTPADALKAFTGAVEQLAPRDRLEVSFGTTDGGGRALSVAPDAPSPAQISASTEGLARLGLWSLVRDTAPAHEVSNASLRGADVGWLAACLPAGAVAASYARLVRGVRAQLPTEAQAPAFAQLRRALELRLSREAPHEAATALATLAGEDLLSADFGVPPMWLPRMVLQTGALSELPAPLLPRVLSADGLPMILETVQRGASLARLAALARALERAPRPRKPAALSEACAQLVPQLLDAGVSDQTLARTVALLLLLRHTGGKAAAAAVARDA
jgi:hypothetical protein